MKTTIKCVYAAAALAAGITASHGQALKVTLDGIYNSANDKYSSFESVGFFNGHDDTTYGTFTNQKYKTTIRYGVAELAGGTPGQQFFFVFAEVPLYAKNMVWGAGMTAEEIGQYGKQLDFSGATGSEKFMFLDSKGDDKVLVDFGTAAPFGDGGKTTFGSKGLGLISFKDSVSYILGNGLGTTSSSAQHNMTMSVEMQFALNATNNNLLIQYARNGLDIHLSPDRGLTPTTFIPEPSTTLLFGMLSVAGLLRRKR